MGSIFQELAALQNTRPRLAGKRRTGILSRTARGGGYANAIRSEDKNGQQAVRLHDARHGRRR